MAQGALKKASSGRGVAKRKVRSDVKSNRRRKGHPKGTITKNKKVGTGSKNKSAKQMTDKLKKKITGDLTRNIESVMAQRVKDAHGKLLIAKPLPEHSREAREKRNAKKGKKRRS
eukprot:TRINITY_DN6108_c0_g1_i1.p2 TRINITY_DN6108_c0_g1~~TRINITY_DN6108_c0_g1_i1.p2  ORF type:complete len:115 (-),score=34.98 TRINITY_DN6108_c0_g1_i1:175-519(-)